MLTSVAVVSLAGILVVWVLYPLVIAGAAALAVRRRASRQTAEFADPARTPFTPTVSVIIATRDDADATKQRIFDCLRLLYATGSLEVVVAVDHRATGSVAELASLPDTVKVVPGDEPGGKAATLNAGVRASRGEILVFADVHQRFQPDAVAHLVAPLRDQEVGAVSGCLDIPPANTTGRRSLAERYWLFERWLREREATLYAPVGVSGSIWAMRRLLWTPLPNDLINDDLYAPMRLVLRGRRIAFACDARAVETRRHEPRAEYARKVRTLTGVIQVCNWLPSVLNPLRNPICAQFVIHKLLRLLTPYWVGGIALWASVTVSRALADNTWLAAAVVAAAALAAALYAANAKIRGIARETLVSGALLQAATIVGTVNGMRRRWDVWHR